MSHFSSVQLSSVVSPVERPEAPIVGKIYRQVGVRLWGQGAYERESIDGGDTQYKTLNRVEVGDIIVNKIWARNGSVSVVWEDTDGCYASGEFPLFVPDQAQLDPRWFFYFTKTPDFWRQCEVKSFGTSGKNRIRPEKFLEIEIPLPPLDEQRRIVAHIDALAEQITAARGLRHGAVEEAEAFVTSSANAIFSKNGWESAPLQSLLSEASLNGIGSRPSDEPPGVPILRISAGTSQQSGLVDEGDFKYLEVDEPTVSKYRLRQGDLLACRFNGNLHYVGRFSLYSAYSGQTHIYPDKLMRFRVNTEVVLPEFVKEAMNSPYGRVQIEAYCATTAGNIGISAGRIKTVFVPVPSLDEQRRIVAYLDALQAEVERLKRLQADTVVELDALLPSLLDRAFRGEL